MKPLSAGSLALLAAILCGGARAEDRVIFGAGTVSCGEWKDYRSHNDKASYFQLQAWVDGYLSGFNAASEGTPDYLISQPSAKALYVWIDNYCAAHSLDILAAAVMALKADLISRAKPR